MMNRKTKLRSLSPILGGIAVSALLMSCASPNYKQGSAAGAGLQASADKIGVGVGLIDATVSSLSALLAEGGDIAAEFKEFSSSVDRLESAAEDVDGKVADMRRKGEEYFNQWNLESAQIQNEDIKKRSVARKAEMQQRFADIRSSYEEASAQFRPFMSDLRDIRTALATDLTAGGLAALRNTAEKTIHSAGPLKSTLEKMAGQFRDLGVAMSANVPPPAAQ